MKPFLLLQVRPEDPAADNEYQAFLQHCELEPAQLHRVRTELEYFPVIKLDDYSGVILGGGPFNTSDEHKSPMQQRSEKRLYNLMQEICERDFPFIGACYGIGILVNSVGGVVGKGKYSEPVSAVEIQLSDEADQLLEGMPSSFTAFAGHKESCQDCPEEVKVLAYSAACPYQMLRYKKNVYATQFHPELDVEGIVLRINVYKNAGYFPAEDADELIKEVSVADVKYPSRILRNFVSKFAV